MPDRCRRGTIPMPVATVLEVLDWHGKTIRPFCTNEGSGMGSSECDIKRLANGATLKAGLSINGSHVQDLTDKIADWARRGWPDAFCPTVLFSGELAVV